MKSLKKIYKYLVKCFFFTIYGKIILEKNSKKNLNKIFNFSNKKKKIKVYQITNCRVFTDTRDVAYISTKNELVSKISIQLAKRVKDNFVMKNGTPKFYKSVGGNCISLLSGSPANQNYFHWMFDVIPRFYLIGRFYNFNKNDKFIISGYGKKFQKESLAALNIKNIYNLIHLKHLKTKNLFCVQPEIIRYGSKFHFPKWITGFLKKKFLVKSFKSLEFERVYISRKDSNYNHLRLCENEKELINYLKQKNFKEIVMSDYSIFQQAYIFNNAKFIISIHGGAFANLVFCKKNCKIIELKIKNTNRIIEALARDLKLKNFSSLEFKNNDPSLAKIGSQFGKFNCNLKNLEKKLIALRCN